MSFTSFEVGADSDGQNTTPTHVSY
ncbi:hypothetical protein V12B01_13630 [Vibrio splendidus 12B01]|nr:hypothetical protein V12B01_13630 [Vibrio splendidus 12B01]